MAAGVFDMMIFAASDLLVADDMLATVFPRRRVRVARATLGAVLDAERHWMSNTSVRGVCDVLCAGR